MKKELKVSKIFGAIAILSGAIWIGSYLTRLFTTYMLFKPEGLVLKDYVNDSNLNAILITISPTVTITFISYIILLLSFSLFLVTSAKKFKQNGWLFIITMLIYLTFPFEAYLMQIDYKMISSYVSGEFNSGYVLGLIIDRFKVLSGFPVIIIFIYLSIPFFIVFKPFTRLDKNEN